MGSRLLKAGHSLVIQDIEPQAMETLKGRGASIVSSPREAAAMAEVIFTAVPTPREAREVCWGPQGLLSGGSPGLTHIKNVHVGCSFKWELAAREAEAGDPVPGISRLRWASGRGSPGTDPLGRGTGGVVCRTPRAPGTWPSMSFFVDPWVMLKSSSLSITSSHWLSVTGEGLCLGIKAGVPLKSSAWPCSGARPRIVLWISFFSFFRFSPWVMCVGDPPQHIFGDHLAQHQRFQCAVQGRDKNNPALTHAPRHLGNKTSA